MSSAFDSISWFKIINNLIKADLDNSLIMACQNLLTERNVVLNNKLYNTKTRIAQGGKSSASLWKIGMNDLLNKLEELKNCVTIAYADDLAILINSSNKTELQLMINETMKIIEKWCDEANVKLNVKKTEVINLSKFKIKLNIKLKNKEVELSDHLKYLGIIIDDKLIFNKHIAHLETKIIKLIEITRRLMWMKKDIQLKYKKRIYYSVFLPIIMYGSKRKQNQTI
jgi:hypothetical protein